MTPRSVLLHPSAVEEAEAATAWYSQYSRRVAESFLAELSWAVEQISQHAEQFPAMDFGTRRLVLRKFPYLLIFRETSTAVEILAVAHGRRQPGYWRHRLG